ncbi:MAG: hypothetical protein R2813_01880 [Flavobacteriales bacterium]
MEKDLIQERYPVFKASEIQKARIKTITIRELNKPSGWQIFDQSRRFHYEYNRKGELIHYRKTYPGHGGRIDTLQFYFEYANGALVQEIERTGRYQRKIRYDRLDAHKTAKLIETRRGNDDWEEVANEVITEKSIDGGWVRYLSGPSSEPYQHEFYLEKESKQSREVWTGSRLQTIQEWKGLTNNEVSYRCEYNFKKDSVEMRLLGDEGEWCINGQCRDWSMVLHENGFPKGWIFMDTKTQDAEIWEFVYQYY